MAQTVKMAEIRAYDGISANGWNVRKPTAKVYFNG
jgi:hypothetical protein